jgi:hypothetical protein
MGLTMARGFESKDVEFQQSEAERRRSPRPVLTPKQRAALERRQATEMSLARAKADLAAARTAAHRQMLTAAVASLEEQLAQFSRGSR